MLRVVTTDGKKGSTSIEDSMNAFVEHFSLKQINYEKVIYKATSRELGVLNYSIDNDIDMIAIGSHGKGIVRKLVKASISQDLVRNTFKPVLTIRF